MSRFLVSLSATTDDLGAASHVYADVVEASTEVACRDHLTSLNVSMLDLDTVVDDEPEAPDLAAATTAALLDELAARIRTGALPAQDAGAVVERLGAAIFVALRDLTPDVLEYRTVDG